MNLDTTNQRRVTYTDADGDKVSVHRDTDGELIVYSRQATESAATIIVKAEDAAAWIDALRNLLPKPCTHCDGKGVA